MIKSFAFINNWNKMPNVHKNTSNELPLDNFIKSSWTLLLVASVAQCVFFATFANLICVLAVSLGWAIATIFFLKINVLRQFPLSSFLVIGFTLTQFYFPLLFTLLEGKPLTFNLTVPYEVFFHSILQLTILTIVHIIYRSYKPKPRSSKSILYRAGLFTPPSETQMWILGVIGLLSMFYIYFYSPSVNQDVSGAGAKFIQGFVPFSYTPFFIPLGKLYGNDKINTKKFVPKLLIFVAILFLISIGRNSRGSFMFGFTGIGFSYCLGMLLGFYNPRIVTGRNIILVVVGYWIFTGPMADLATAMILLRGRNKEQTRTELIALTWKEFNDKKAINNYRLNAQVQQSQIGEDGWNEYYLNDVFLARFANIKYNDESIVQSDKIARIDDKMTQFSNNRFLAFLPDPFLRFLGFNNSKVDVSGVSFGDYLYFRAGAGSSVLGGFRSANLAGTGMAAYGWWYLIILGLTMPIIFILLDKFVAKRIIVDSTNPEQKKIQIRFSLAGLLIITSIFKFMSVESIVEFGGFVIRGWLQQVFLYFCMFHLSKQLSTMFSNNKSRRFAKVRSIV